MRLVDVLFRHGHLSESALVDAIMTGHRPAHLERCDLCAERAVEMNRWLENVRTVAVDAADDAFPAERLAAQQAQIQRRLEQIDEPARVIAFPGQVRADLRDSQRRRVSPAWVGVAAAAGLVIGVIGGQATARLGPAPPAVVIQAPAATAPAEASDPVPANSWIDADDLERFTPEPLAPFDEATPRSSLITMAMYN
jgi:hypothetical protein